MKLCVDVGNTTIRMGFYVDDEIIYSFAIDTNITLTKELVLSYLNNINVDEVRYIIYSSVVPSVDESLNDILSLIFYKATKYDLHDIYLGQIMMDVANPKEVGSDLIADLVSAKNRYPSPLVIIDLGTATKMLLIDKNHTFTSALIMPGIKVSAESLYNNAALLNEVDLDQATNLLDSKNTSNCIKHGVIFGHIEMINGLVSRYEKELGYSLNKIITGGSSSLINKYLDGSYILDEYLLLNGELDILNDYLAYKGE